MMSMFFDFDLLRRGGVAWTQICDCNGLRLDVLAAPPTGGRLAVYDSSFDCDSIEVCSQCSEFSDDSCCGARGAPSKGLDRWETLKTKIAILDHDEHVFLFRPP